MVSESPSKGCSDCSLSLGVSFDGKVPDASGSSDDELAHSIDEGSNPEKSKDLVIENVSGCVAPLDVSHKAPWFITSLWLSN